MNRIFSVYKGMINNQIVYIGTTIQVPEERFRWHKYNGKDFAFEVIKQFDNETDMLNLEFELIKKHNPRYNKIKHRKQNLNVVLTSEILESRKGDVIWCQCCLKRHVNKGYKYCYFCK